MTIADIIYLKMEYENGLFVLLLMGILQRIYKCQCRTL